MAFIRKQVDEYIQKLDKDIKRFENEIKEVAANEIKEPLNDYLKNDISSNNRKSLAF